MSVAPDAPGAANRSKIVLGVDDLPENLAALRGFVTAADVLEGVRAGGNDFIVKPVDRDRLLQRLQHWIGRRV